MKKGIFSLDLTMVLAPILAILSTIYLIISTKIDVITAIIYTGATIPTMYRHLELIDESSEKIIDSSPGSSLFQKKTFISFLYISYSVNIPVSLFISVSKILIFLSGNEYLSNFITLVLIFSTSYFMRYKKYKIKLFHYMIITIFTLRIFLIFISVINTSLNLDMDFFRSNFVTDAILVSFAFDGLIRAIDEYRKKNRINSKGEIMQN